MKKGHRVFNDIKEGITQVVGETLLKHKEAIQASGADQEELIAELNPVIGDAISAAVRDMVQELPLIAAALLDEEVDETVSQAFFENLDEQVRQASAGDDDEDDDLEEGEGDEDLEEADLDDEDLEEGEGDEDLEEADLDDEDPNEKALEALEEVKAEGLALASALASDDPEAAAKLKRLMRKL